MAAAAAPATSLVSTPEIPLSAHDAAMAERPSPLDAWKAWGLQQLKLARRALSERLGKAIPTVDRVEDDVITGGSEEQRTHGPLY